MTTPPLQDRTALVTGGGRGIGRACCVRLAQSGARVAVNFVENEVTARETAALVEALGAKACVVQADVSSQEDVQRMIAAVEASLGPIDLLVNNAGVFHFVDHQGTTPEIWQRQIDVNLTGVYNVTWAVKPGMIARRFGRIVNVSSIAGLRPRPLSIAYAATKAAVVSLTQGLAEALAAHNIRINCVAPGLTETDILDGVEPSQLDALIQATPISRIGQPQDIAEAVEFLLSDRASFITGQTLVVDGGRVMLP
ncbi:MAG: 3-oxoacyl-ACP reductase FabG [Planctomycetes bacterium]|nr:3-oxoacyl-ACP reductase FabG [Planctomycetota bacterium]